MSDRLRPRRAATVVQWTATLGLVGLLVTSALARQCLGGRWKDTTNKNLEVELTIDPKAGIPVVAKYVQPHGCPMPPHLPLQTDFDGYLLSRIHIAGTLHMCRYAGGKTIGYYDAPELLLTLQDDGTLRGPAKDYDGSEVQVILERVSAVPPRDGRCPEDTARRLSDDCEHAVSTSPSWGALSRLCRQHGYAVGKPTDMTPGAGAPVRPTTSGQQETHPLRDLIESEKRKAHPE
jgi:hypothetical protein